MNSVNATANYLYETDIDFFSFEELEKRWCAEKCPDPHSLEHLLLLKDVLGWNKYKFLPQLSAVFEGETNKCRYSYLHVGNQDGGV